MRAEVKEKLVERLEQDDVKLTTGNDLNLIKVNAFVAAKYDTQGQMREAASREIRYGLLGLLIELWREETGQGEWRDEGHYMAFDIPGKMGSVQFLPPVVAQWAGTDTNPHVGRRRLAWLFFHSGYDKQRVIDVLKETPAEEIV